MVESNHASPQPNGMNTWRAGCGESRTSGSEGGPGKPTSRKADRAPRSDPYIELPTSEGKLFCCAIEDVWSNKIVGYSIDIRMKATLVRAAMRNAIALRSPVGTISHCDRGGQFRAKKPQALLANNNLIGSMGRANDAGDNASMESFFSLLQKNVLNTRCWNTRAELRLAIVSWIETKYNRRRRQRALGKLTPTAFEMIYMAAQAA